MATSSHVKESIGHFVRFCQKPLSSIKTLPTWTVDRWIVFQILLGIGFGVLTGIINQSLWQILGMLVYGPLLVLITASLATLGFQQSFRWIFKHEVSFLKVYAVTITAMIPLVITRSLASFSFPFEILGLCAFCYLMSVGSHEGLTISKRRSSLFFGFLFGILFIFWLLQTLDDYGSDLNLDPKKQSINIEEIEKELEL